MKKLHILVDCDVVLNNLLESWVACLNGHYNISAKAEDINIWDLKCIYPLLSDEEINSPLTENSFWKNLEPNPDSKKYLKKMIDDGYEVSIVTAHSIYQTVPAKVDWILEKFPFLSWSDIIITSKKQKIIGDVLIDDGIHNLEGGSYFKILYNCSYNSIYAAEAYGMVRVYSLKEAYETIKENLMGVNKNE